jgi:NAD(P)-dependent dehydrogenase (short-subunit alcohol dehydrogenase family)
MNNIIPEFEEKVVLVTGAGRGLGRAIARAFAAQGAYVAANDLTPINLDDTLAMIADEGGQVSGFLADVSRKMEVQALAAQVIETFGSIDVLINNAGVSPRVELLSLDEWDWDRTVAVNLKGPFLLMQTVGRLMVDAAGGVIINVASSQAIQGTLPGGGAFLASKAGLLALTRQAALELAPHNIRVNAVCPASPPSRVLSEVWQKRQTEHIPEADEDAIRATIARAVLYLSSPRATFITGETVTVDPRRGMGLEANPIVVEKGS